MGSTTFHGKSAGKAHLSDPQAMLALNLKFGAGATPGLQPNRLNYQFGQTEHGNSLEEDSLMQDMIDCIHGQESGEAQRRKENEEQRDTRARNSSSSMQKEWREDGSGGGVTPWRTRMTKARNTLEGTANAAPLLGGIQGSTIMIH